MWTDRTAVAHTALSTAMHSIQNYTVQDNGYWTPRGYANSRIANSRTGRLADLSTRRLDNSRTGQVADWTTRGCHWRLCVLSFPFWQHLRDRELSSPRVDQSASWQSASWRIRELSSYQDNSNSTAVHQNYLYSELAALNTTCNICCYPRLTTYMFLSAINFLFPKCYLNHPFSDLPHFWMSETRFALSFLRESRSC